jgi:hypothetical protein
MKVARQAASGKRRGVARAALALLLVLLGITALPTARAQDPKPTPEDGSAALTAQVDYWDLGLRIAYPLGWSAPQFSAGQLALSPPGAVGEDGTLLAPIVALRIFDPVADFELAKDATFIQIAAAVNVAPGQTVAMTSSGDTTIAGLDAGYADILDGETSQAGQTVAFMMPDGRYGALLAVAPLDVWADFAPTFSAIRQSAVLLLPADYQAPEAGDEVEFSPGSVHLTLPAGWTAESVDDSAHLYGDPAHSAYMDGSGFANGPQLVILAQPRPAEGTLAEALAAVIGESAGDVTGDVSVGERPAALRQTVDARSGQIIAFVGFEAADGATLNIFRWTTPGILRDASQPVLLAILASVR